VTTRLTAAALVASAAFLDVVSAHGLAELLLVAAVPAAGIAGLQALAAALVEPTRSAQVQVVPAAAALVLVVTAAALRAPLTGAEEPPAAAALALSGALVAVALQALVAGVALVRRHVGVGILHERVAPWRP
jgi:hypothetical protein